MNNKIIYLIIAIVLFCVIEFFRLQNEIEAVDRLRRIEPKLDEVIELHAQTANQIEHEKSRIDTIFASISDNELLRRARRITGR